VDEKFEEQVPVLRDRREKGRELLLGQCLGALLVGDLIDEGSGDADAADRIRSDQAVLERGGEEG